MIWSERTLGQSSVAPSVIRSPNGLHPLPLMFSRRAKTFSQPDAADREPAFWTDGAGKSTPDDDFVQADAAESI